MSNLDRFAVIYVAGYAIFVAIRGSYDTGGNRSPAGTTDLLELVVMALVASGVMITPLVFVFTPLLDAFNFRANPAVQATGAGLMGLSLLLFWLSHVHLGRNFSRTLEIHEDHTLVTNGLYRFVRHPMCAAIWLFAFSQALLLPNWIAALSGVVGFAPMYFLRVPREEAMMIKEFGSQYETYRDKTPRLIPSTLGRTS